MIQQEGEKLIQNKTKDVVSNDLYDKLLEKVFPHSLKKSKTKTKTKTRSKTKTKTKTKKNKSRKLKK